jgi:hypothetical protein
MSHITEIETIIKLHNVGAPGTPLQIMTKLICSLPPSISQLHHSLGQYTSQRDNFFAHISVTERRNHGKTLQRWAARLT